MNDEKDFTFAESVKATLAVIFLWIMWGIMSLDAMGKPILSKIGKALAPLFALLLLVSTAQAQNCPRLCQAMTTAGDMIINNTQAESSRLPIGTTGQVLVVDATGIPQWSSSAAITGATGNFTIGGNLIFSAAAAKIIPGATSLLVRNNADSASNLEITDAGVLTLRGATTLTDAGTTVTAALAGDANRKIILGASSDTAHAITFGDGGTTAAQTLSIHASTADADDDSATNVGGGGGIGVLRGAGITLRGNEHTSGPDVIINAGQAAGGDISIATNNAGNSITFYTANSAQALALDSSQNTLAAGTITSSRTTDLGWTVVAGADTACNSTCTSACVAGWNLTAGNITGTLLACTDATADACLCAGAS